MIGFASDETCARCGSEDLAFSRESEARSAIDSPVTSPAIQETDGKFLFNFGTLAAIVYLFLAGSIVVKMIRSSGGHSDGVLVVFLFLLGSPWSWATYIFEGAGIIGKFIGICVFFGSIPLNAYIFHRLGARLTAFLMRAK